MVELYTKDNCPQCKFTKKKLDKLNVLYNENNVESDEAALAHIKALGYMSLPVVEFKETHFSGYRPTELAQIAEQLAV